MKTVTQRLRHGCHVMEPVCGFTVSPPAPAKLACGVSTSQVRASCHASNVPGQRSVGKGLPKSSHAFPAASFHNTGWPSGMGGAFGAAADFVHTVFSFSNTSFSSCHTARLHS